MDLKKYIFRVNKRTLLLIAGIVWMFAGFRVLTLFMAGIFFLISSLKFENTKIKYSN